MSYLCIGKTKEKLPRAHTGKFSSAQEKFCTKDEKRLEVNDKSSGGQLNNQ
jgi:hypothetical protein